MTVHIHTDGSCHGNPGPGGWAAVILSPDGNNRTLSGRDASATNNRMELTAVIRGLGALRQMPWTQGHDVVVHSDSRYVIDAFLQNWIPNWERNNWRNARRQPVANRELWEELIPPAAERQIRWEWVKGHSGDQWNELCDRIANREAFNTGSGIPEETAPIAGILTPIVCMEQSPEPEAASSGQDAYYIQGYEDGCQAARQEMMRMLQGMTGTEPGTEPKINSSTEADE